jgi:hypothetical protein
LGAAFLDLAGAFAAGFDEDFDADFDADLGCSLRGGAGLLSCATLFFLAGSTI